MAQTLGSVAVGTVVKINESGSPVNYLVVHQGLPSSMYDASCYGTWVLRQDIYQYILWNSTNYSTLSGSTIMTTMASMLPLYDSFIQSAIKTVKIPYCVGGPSSTVLSGTDGLSCQIFPLGGYEVGYTKNYATGIPMDGSVLQYFVDTSVSAEEKRVSNFEGEASEWWLRTPNTNKLDQSYRITSDGSITIGVVNLSKFGIRPAFILPQNLYVDDNGNITQPAPASITVPSIAMQGQPINVSWSSVSGADSYILQRKADGGGWTQVYAGNDLIFTDTAGSWTTVQYQVCGVFDGANGAFAQSDPISIIPASALVISGSDGDLGTVTNDITYNVTSDTGNQISLTRTVNGALVASLTVNSGFSYNIPVMDLPTGTGTIVITATVQTSSDPVTVTRTWTYTKVAQTFPGSGGVAQLAKDGQNVFPMTLAEAVKAIGGPWGGNLSSALNKLAMAATFAATPIPKYSHVDVNLSTAQSGDIVNLPVNGVMVPHIVVQVGNPDPSMYDASCDGVWLLRQDIVENGQWNSSGVNTLSGATIMTTMQGYVDDYDPTVQAAIQTVKIPYCVGGGDTAVKTLENGLQCKMFPLSAQEIGCGDYPGTGTVPEDGAKLDYFPLGYANSTGKRLSKYNGENSDWFTRSQLIINSSSVWLINSVEGFTNDPVTDSLGIRPCFTLPATFAATYYVDESGNVYTSQEYTTTGDFYDLWGNVIPTVKIATGSYTGTGTYGADNPNTLTLPFEPKVLIVSAMMDAQTGHTAWIYGDSSGAVNSSYAVILSWDNNTVSWYSPNSASYQLNGNALSYQYVAIG